MGASGCEATLAARGGDAGDTDAAAGADGGPRDSEVRDEGAGEAGADGPLGDAAMADGARGDLEPHDAGPTDGGAPADAATPVDARLMSPDVPAEPDAAPEPPDAAPLPSCPVHAEAVLTGNAVAPGIIEASGLAESRRNPGVFWTHNDAGNGPQVFALTAAGEHLGVFELDGQRPRDWEDLSVGPGPDPALSYVYVGDVGDNLSQRAELSVRRFPEPEVPRGAEPLDVRLEGVETFTLLYPDGPHNCETLLVDPRGGDVYVVVKSADGVSPVFRAPAPLSPDMPNRLERVAELTFGQEPLRSDPNTTGGDISAAGDAIVIRTYGAVFLWRRHAQATVAEALATEPCRMPRPQDRQGEAIAFAADGGGYYTISEGLSSPVYYFERR